MEKMFEKALRNKFRYEYNGTINTEDLFSLSVRVLNSIYTKLDEELDKVSGKSLLNNKTDEQQLIEDKMEVVKYIFDLKMKEIEEAKNAAEINKKKQEIMYLIKEKDAAELKDKSKDELLKMLEELNK